MLPLADSMSVDLQSFIRINPGLTGPFCVSRSSASSTGSGVIEPAATL